jgi:hypothetical protein
MKTGRSCSENGLAFIIDKIVGLKKNCITTGAVHEKHRCDNAWIVLRNCCMGASMFQEHEVLASIKESLFYAV